jgi:hypothetical protein
MPPHQGVDILERILGDRRSRRASRRAVEGEGVGLSRVREDHQALAEVQQLRDQNLSVEVVRVKSPLRSRIGQRIRASFSRADF